MDSLSTLVSDQPIHYDGTQLNPHWIYRQFHIQGNALVAFIGEARVTLDNMVDLEDVFKKAPIYSPLMTHFIGEWFIDSWDEGILWQHHFVSSIYGALWEKGIGHLRRRGNDIYYKERKLNVSIATKSLGSILMHTGINVRTENTPVPTAGLAELGLDPTTFATEILEIFARDVKIMRNARVKCLTRPGLLVS